MKICKCCLHVDKLGKYGSGNTPNALKEVHYEDLKYPI